MDNKGNLTEEQLKNLMKDPVSALEKLKSIKQVKLNSEIDVSTSVDDIDLKNINNFYNVLSTTFLRVSSCYKFLWFYAILKLLPKNKDAIKYNEIINLMIKVAYKLHENGIYLGSNAVVLNNLLNYLSENGIGQKELINEIDTNPNILTYKKQLIVYVPYHFQSMLLNDNATVNYKKSPKSLIAMFNAQDNMIYKYSEFDQLNTAIYIHDDWYKYLLNNNDLLGDWVKFRLMLYIFKFNKKVQDVIQYMNCI